MSAFGNKSSNPSSRARSSRFFTRDQASSKNVIDLTDDSAEKENANENSANLSHEESFMDVVEGGAAEVTKSAQKEGKGLGLRRKSSPFFGKKRKGNKGLSSPPALEKEDTCAICLDSASSPAKLDSCIHVFCFECINQWAKIKLECPYCKVEFKTATCRDKTTGLCRTIEFDEPHAAAESDDEEYGYFEEEGYDEDEDSDYEPRDAGDAMHGYESDGGFIVHSDDDNESSFEEEESFNDELQAAEAALEAGRSRNHRRRRREARGRGAPVDLVSPEMRHNRPLPPNRQQDSADVMDLVSPDSEGGPSSPVDLLSRFGFSDNKRS